jgi:co-chaperonin GroES (HSP10)
VTIASSPPPTVALNTKQSIMKVPNDMVAIIPMDDADSYTRGGLIIRPDSAKERCDQGIVKYIGRNVRETSDIKPGDHVFFKGYTGTMVSLEGEGRMIFLLVDHIDFKLQDVPSTEVYGLYFRDREGEYFRATYSMAVELIRDAINETDWFKGIKYDAKVQNRTLKEIERKRKDLWKKK